MGWQARHDAAARAHLFQFLAGFVTAGLLLVGASLLCYGLGAWQEFAADLLEYRRVFFVLSIGLKKAVVYFPGIGNRNVWWAEGVVRMAQWNDTLHALLAQRMWIYWPITLVAAGTAVVLACGMAPVAAGLLVGGVFFYVSVVALQYYYVYLPLFAVAGVGRSATRADRLRMGTVLVAMLLIMLGKQGLLDDILQFEWYSYVLGGCCAGLLIITGLEHRRKMRTRRME